MNRLPFIAAVILFGMSVQTSPGEEQSSTPIRVGVLHSMSGTMAISEQSLIDAIHMAIDEINHRGGVLGRPLVPIVEDGESSAPTFARKAEKLIVEDKVVSVFGCWTSASRKAVLPVFVRHNHLLWYPVQYEGRERCPNIIYTGATPNQQITPAVEWCRRKFGPRMFLVGSDYIFPQTANEIIKLRLADFGVPPVGEEYRPLGDNNFDEIVAAIKKSEPDVVLNTINGGSNRAFFKALAAAGIDHRKIPVMSFSIAEDELQDIGIDLTAGNYCSWNYFQSIDTPANRRFVREFRNRYGADRVTDDAIEAAYFQVHLFAKAVEKAGSTEVDAVRRAARGLILAAPGGLVRIDPQNQHTWKVSRIGRIQPDGQFKIVWSSEDPLPPRPWLPETFLAAATEHGETMFTGITTMIDLESKEQSDNERKQLLSSMADVRGFLGNARTTLRTAALSNQPQNRLAFENAWKELELRWNILTDRNDQLTDGQRESFERFAKNYAAFAENSASMFEALYPAASTVSEVNP